MTHQNPSSAISFISSGVSCFALLFLDRIGILDSLCTLGKISQDQLSSSEDRMFIETALVELEVSGLVEKNEDIYTLTPLGSDVVHYLGLIHYIYSGYCNVLSSPEQKNEINHASVIRGSNLLGEKYIDNAILKELSFLTISKTICDLGCGDGRRLSKLCDLYACNGLGFEIEKLNETKNELSDSVQIQKADITKLQGIWNDVTVLMQVMVMHDFTPDDACLAIINSFLKHFPCLKYFLYCDVVAYSDAMKIPLPGFDYIHSLLGVKARTYEQTINLFKNSEFEIFKEIAIDRMPNTFLWILMPKNQENRIS